LTNEILMFHSNWWTWISENGIIKVRVFNT